MRVQILVPTCLLICRVLGSLVEIVGKSHNPSWISCHDNFSDADEMKSQALSNAQRAIQDQEARVWCLVGGHVIMLRQLSIYNFVVRMVAFEFFQ